MSFKATYALGPDYAHLLGGKIAMVFESGAARRGTILRQLRGVVRGDILFIALTEPIPSPQGRFYTEVAICTRAGGDLLTDSGRPTVVNVLVSEITISNPSEPLDATSFVHATEATVTVLVDDRDS